MTSLLPVVLADAVPVVGPLIESLVTWTLDLGIVIIALGTCACIFRIVYGPHLADRAVGADTLAIHLIVLIGLLTMRLRTIVFFDGVLVLSLLGFAGTVAMAQFIARPHLRRLTQSPSTPH